MNLKKALFGDRALDKIKNKYHLDKIFGLYNELIKDENIIAIDNFSIDFIVQNNSSQKEFEEGLNNFKNSFNNRKYLKLFKEDYIKEERKGKYKMLTIKNKSNHNSMSAFFFKDESKNEWMIHEIEKKLNMHIPIVIFDGVILAKDGKELKVIFSDKYFKV